MGVRLTGISTPIVGASWEFTDKKDKTRDSHVEMISPREKIKVFISSKCGDEKYDTVRKKLTESIENTNLAKVYLFEGTGPATVSAKDHYILSLRDCDVCIFLIDNNDGVPEGVQNEVDTARKYNIKSIYFFCDENSKEVTPLQKSLFGANNPKCSTIHHFDDICSNGAQALIDDIIFIYHFYCKGWLSNSAENEQNNSNNELLKIIEEAQIPEITKKVINGNSKCQKYIKNFVAPFFMDEEQKEKPTNGIDEWGEQFFQVLFGKQSIKQFNTGMFMEELKKTQTASFHKVVSIRWQAIQAYFEGDISKCVLLLTMALKEAQDSKQQTWLIQDILIDLRNQQNVFDTIHNQHTFSDAQKALLENEEVLYYPVIDRMIKQLHEKYTEGLYTNKIQSPYSIQFGSNINELVGFITSSYIIALYNGSLTYILSVYDELKDLFFYLSTKYPDIWQFKMGLLKFNILLPNEKEISGIRAAYPEIENKLSDEDAVEIMEICNAHPVGYKRMISRMYAFGTVGYYLSDEHYTHYEKGIIKEINDWLDDKSSVIAVATSIIKCLSGVALRISQDDLAQIVCKFFDRHYMIQYRNLFTFLADWIRIDKMSKESAQRLIEHINILLDDEKEREEAGYSSRFLYVLRKQSRELTDPLDEKIKVYFPRFYEGDYLLETTQNTSVDYPIFIRKYIEMLREKNEEQGKDGVFHGYATMECGIIRSLMCDAEVSLPEKDMDALISAVCDTLLYSKQDINVKIGSVSLLMCIFVKYYNDYTRNSSQFSQLINQKDNIDAYDEGLIGANIDRIALKICLDLFSSAMGNDVYSEIVESIACIKDDIATTLCIERFIINYLNLKNDITFAHDIEAVILQNTLQWLRSSNTDVRYYAAYILLLLSRTPNNSGIINHQIINMINAENAYIKNLILRKIENIPCLESSTKAYILSKCEHDANYVVRDACQKAIRER